RMYPLGPEYAPMSGVSRTPKTQFPSGREEASATVRPTRVTYFVRLGRSKSGHWFVAAMAMVRPISSSSASDMVRAEPALVPASTYSPVRPPMRLPREMLEPPELPPLEQPAMRMRERRG